MTSATAISRHEHGITVSYDQSIQGQFIKGESGKFLLMSLAGPWNHVNVNGEPDNPVKWTMELDPAHLDSRNEHAGDILQILDSVNFGLPLWTHFSGKMIVIGFDGGNAQAVVDGKPDGGYTLVSAVSLSGGGPERERVVNKTAERMVADLNSGTGLGRLNLDLEKEA